jgi:hypothetical protein
MALARASEVAPSASLGADTRPNSPAQRTGERGVSAVSPNVRWIATGEGFLPSRKRLITNCFDGILSSYTGQSVAEEKLEGKGNRPNLPPPRPFTDWNTGPRRMLQLPSQKSPVLPIADQLVTVTCVKPFPSPKNAQSPFSSSTLSPQSDDERLRLRESERRCFAFWRKRTVRTPRPMDTEGSSDGTIR